MPTPDQPNPGHRGINWPAVAKTFLVQVVVLAVLAAALVGYIQWSSDVAFEEYVAAGKAVPDTKLQLQPATAVHAVKDGKPCARENPRAQTVSH